jgi:CubicO group peptidase (beta-lactamase class C family)
MRKRVLIGSVMIPVLCGALWTAYRPDRALRVATAAVSHDLCSETFVSGLDPDQVFAESLKPRPGLRRIARALRYDVDRTDRQVTVTLAGAFASRAVYRDHLGCVVARGPAAAPTLAPASVAPDGTTAAILPEIAGPDAVEPADARLRAVLDHAFAEPDQPPHRWTKAVVVVHDGHVIAERYAPGYGVRTPMLGFSMAKSIINALVGVLVRDGKLTVDEPAPVRAWQGPNDPRRVVTIDQLMRMTSGLDFDETGSAFDRTEQMKYLEPDMATYAESFNLKATPGARWAYSSASTHVLARIIRDAVGGQAEDVLRFAHQELFDPLGMRNVAMEFDATGTPIGSHYVLAAARDWARFGLLYLNDGVVADRRVLPGGWVRYSSSPTNGTDYGAGFWTNVGAHGPAKGRVRMGMPADSFYASGNLGQRVVMIQSEDLVVVRLGRSHHDDGDIEGFERLVSETVAAVRAIRQSEQAAR